MDVNLTVVRQRQTERKTARCCRWMIGMAWMERQGQRSEAGSGGARRCEWLRGGTDDKALHLDIPAPQIKPILARN